MKRFDDLLIVEQNDKIEYVPLSRIVYCESLKWSTKIHLIQPTYLVANRSLQEVVKIINDPSFEQINNTQYLNKKYIERFNMQKQVLTTILNQELPYLLKH